MMNKIKTYYDKIPIGKKITVIFCGFFTLMLFVSSVLIIGVASFHLHNSSEKELEESSQAIIQFIQEGNGFNRDMLSEINPNKLLEFAVINNTDNTVAASYVFSAFSQGDNNRREISISTLEAAPPSYDEPPGFKHNEYMTRIDEFTYDGKDYTVKVYKRMMRERAAIFMLSFVYIGTNILGITAAYFTSKYISKRILKPVMQVKETAESISINDLSKRIELNGTGDELMQLADTFNAMIDRLERSFKNQIQFVSDASHELRTPISVINGYANLIDRWGKSDPSVLQESIDSIKAETEHMTVLVKKLLFLAKDDSGKLQIISEIVSLNDVAKEVIREIRLLDNGQNVALTEDEEAVITGDYDLIKQLMWIFIENSIKYKLADKENYIEIRVYKENGKPFFSVADNGVGVPQEDLPYIFDRFYRVDKSRNKEIQGTGLGLSIAKSIVKKHGGTVEAFSDGTGLKVVVGFD